MGIDVERERMGIDIERERMGIDVFFCRGKGGTVAPTFRSGDLAFLRHARTPRKIVCNQNRCNYYWVDPVGSTQRYYIALAFLRANSKVVR